MELLKFKCRCILVKVANHCFHFFVLVNLLNQKVSQSCISSSFELIHITVSLQGLPFCNLNASTFPHFPSSQTAKWHSSHFVPWHIIESYSYTLKGADHCFHFFFPDFKGIRIANIHLTPYISPPIFHPSI
jgi:hypothetical protein